MNVQHANVVCLHNVNYFFVGGREGGGERNKRGGGGLYWLCICI